MGYEILNGDVIEQLKTLSDESVQTVITSPPYWGLRDYGTGKWEGGDAECDHVKTTLSGSACKLRNDGREHIGLYEGEKAGTFSVTPYRDVCGKCGAIRIDNQIGLEKTPQEFVAKMVEVFREVRRVLRKDGTCWVNLGDSYSGGGRGNYDVVSNNKGNAASRGLGRPSTEGLKPKDLVGIPWRVAFALQQPYTNWRIKSEAMRAWVGGIVDGEGCITILRTKSSHSDSLSFPPIVQVHMCDREPLERLVEVAGSSYGAPQMPPSHAAARQRESFQWKVVSDIAAQIIGEIYPFLTCKRKQAIVAWNHQQFRAARGNQARDRGEIEKEQFCKELINQLNQRRPADIPSWMKEPTVIEEPGWFLRQDLIWAKPNPMPESVTDRCTKAHEYLFLLTKSAKYYFNHEAIKEPIATAPNAQARGDKATPDRGPREGFNTGMQSAALKMRSGETTTRNKRDVWTIPTQPYRGAHFAVFPEKLVEPCVLAGSSPGSLVLDPFCGSGTVGVVSTHYGRNFVGIELNPEYIELAYARITSGSKKLRKESNEQSTSGPSSDSGTNELDETLSSPEGYDLPQQSDFL